MEKQTFHQGLGKLGSNQITFNQQKKKIHLLTSTTDSTKHPSNLTAVKGNVSIKRESANTDRRNWGQGESSGVSPLCQGSPWWLQSAPQTLFLCCLRFQSRYLLAGRPQGS